MFTLIDLHQVSRGGLVHGIRVMKKNFKIDADTETNLMCCIRIQCGYTHL